MTNEELQQIFYWSADNIHVWAPTVVAALAYFIIGIGHLVAIATKNG